METSIEPVIDLCIRYDEKTFVTANWGIARMWLNEGMDMEKDILPIMGKLMKQKPKGISSLSYFTNAIRDARQKRLDTELAKAKIEAKRNPDSDTVLGKMRRLAWLRDNRPHLLRADYRYELEEYERRNGKIAP